MPASELSAPEMPGFAHADTMLRCADEALARAHAQVAAEPAWVRQTARVPKLDALAKCCIGRGIVHDIDEQAKADILAMSDRVLSEPVEAASGHSWGSDVFAELADVLAAEGHAPAAEPAAE